MNKINKYDIIEVVVILLLFLFAFSHIAFWFKVLGLFTSLMINNYARSKSKSERTKSKELSMKFVEELEPGSYLFMTIPVQYIFCFLTGDYNLYFAFLEHNGEAIPVVIGVNTKIKIQNAMGVKFINQIERGEGFEIDQKHDITRM